MFVSDTTRRPYFAITVVDEKTGRGVPLVELRTVSGVRYVTDSNGIVAFHEPGLMNAGDVFFHVSSHGYTFPSDGLGMRGAKLKPTPGGRATLRIRRDNLAERLYRITGEGIYRDSVLVGASRVPLKQPLLNAQVTGQDSALALPHRGKILWLWGDTNRASYPLGNFATSGATSLPPGRGGLDPSVGIDLTYFVGKDGFCRAMAPMPEPGIVWLDGLALVSDGGGGERLVAAYERLKKLGEPLGQGLVVFNDRTQTFEPDARLPLGGPLRPCGHSFRHGEHVYFAFPYPNLRAPATLDALRNPGRYEGFTPLAPGARFEGKRTRLERGADGRSVWAWKPNTPPLSPDEQRELVAAGMLRPDESPFDTRDNKGAPVHAHRSSVAWNAFRKRWVMIFVEQGGSPSYLGEVWYAESPNIEGPWRRATKVVTHERYSFYNPVHRPFFDQSGGRFIYFEGTYVNSFTGSPETPPTPRYDYNQMMYRLDLADPRLHTT